jgi:hypothetical protein
MPLKFSDDLTDGVCQVLWWKLEMVGGARASTRGGQ